MSQVLFTQPLLPCSSGAPRAALLRHWLKLNKRRLKDYATAMDVHPSAPGKWLISESESLPEARRRQLLELGVPVELLP